MCVSQTPPTLSHSPSQTRYIISVSRLIYFASCICTDRRGPRRHCTSSIIYLYIGTLIGHHFIPGTVYIQEGMRVNVERKKKRQIYQTNFVLRPTSIVGHCRRPGFCRKWREKKLYIYIDVFCWYI